MTRLRRFSIAVLAAATVALGSLATAPTASPRPCPARKNRPRHSVLDHWGRLLQCGAYWHTTYWWGKADGIMVGC